MDVIVNRQTTSRVLFSYSSPFKSGYLRICSDWSGSADPSYMFRRKPVFTKVSSRPRLNEYINEHLGDGQI